MQNLKRYLPLILGLTILIISFGVYTLSRYVLEEDTASSEVNLAAFYFTSDELTESGASYLVSRSDYIELEIYSFQDLANWSEMAVEFEYTIYVEVPSGDATSAGVYPYEDGDTYYYVLKSGGVSSTGEDWDEVDTTAVTEDKFEEQKLTTDLDQIEINIWVCLFSKCALLLSFAVREKISSVSTGQNYFHTCQKIVSNMTYIISGKFHFYLF